MRDKRQRDPAVSPFSKSPSSKKPNKSIELLSKRPKQGQSIELDEIEVLTNLYESALASHQHDPSLLYGCIHECDKMIRVRHSKIDATPEELQALNQFAAKIPNLPQKFHLIYANSLFYSSLVEGETDITGFLDAAIERALIGLEFEEEYEYVPDLLHSISRSLIHKSVFDNDCSENISSFKLYVKKLQSCIIGEDHLSTNSDDQILRKDSIMEMLVEVSKFCFNLVDKLDDHKLVHEWLEYLEGLWEFIIENGTDFMQGKMGLGDVFLTRADFAMISENPTPDAKSSDSIISSLKTAVDIFLEVIKTSEKYAIEAKIKLGETYVNLGNILSDDENFEEEDAGIEFYKLGYKNLRNVMDLDQNVLPEEFLDFMKDWEQDFIDDKSPVSS
jgi:hypothetical protein